MSAKRFAICLYGHIRTWEKCKQTLIDKVIEHVDPVIPDIFVHTYDRNNTTNNIYYTEKQIKDMLIFKLKNGTVITPKVIVIQQNDIVQEQNRIECQPLFASGCPNQTPNTYSQVKKIYLCHQEMEKYEAENGFKYDYVLYTRFDNNIINHSTSTPGLTIETSDRKFDLDEIEENTFYNYHSGAPDPCDEMVYGTRDSMDKFVIRYQEIFNVPTQHLWIGAVPTSCSHLLLRYCSIKHLGRDWGWVSPGIMKKQC